MESLWVTPLTTRAAFMSLDLLKGTLDVLILKTLSWGPRHGYGISKAIRQATDDDFRVEEGALYPALRRLEKKGLLSSEWDVTETGREAKFYRLTTPGEARLRDEVATWQRYVRAMSAVLLAERPGG